VAGPEVLGLSATDHSANAKPRADELQHFADVDRRLYDLKRLHPLWAHEGFLADDPPGHIIQIRELTAERDAVIENLQQFGITPQDAETISGELRQHWDAGRNRELLQLAGLSSVAPTSPAASETASGPMQATQAAKTPKGFDAGTTPALPLEPKAKRKTVEKHKGDPRTWPFLLQDLEASKMIQNIVTGPREFMSEAFVRESISRHLGIKPEDVTKNQIRHAVASLLPYCPSITVIPTEPTKDTRADPEVAKDSTGIIGPKTKRGPKANMEFHRAVAEVVHSFGPNWKKHLEQIAGKLDKRNLPPPVIWAKRNPPARSWKRAVAQYPDVLLKALAYSLKMTAREVTGKPSQTLAHPR
jgi:hypothetical protein